MTRPREVLAEQIRYARADLAEYHTGTHTAREWAQMLAGRLRALLWAMPAGDILDDDAAIEQITAAAADMDTESIVVLIARLSEMAGDPPPVHVDADARHTMVLAHALGEIAAVCRTQWVVVTAWLAGELPDTPAEHVASVLYTLPEKLESARDVVLVAVRNRADRHAAQDASDGLHHESADDFCTVPGCEVCP